MFYITVRTQSYPVNTELYTRSVNDNIYSIVFIIMLMCVDIEVMTICRVIRYGPVHAYQYTHIVRLDNVDINLYVNQVCELS